MSAEIRVVKHVYYIMRSIGVLLAQLVEYVELDNRLVKETLLVPYDFDGHMCVGLVIQRPDHLSETALANHLQYLVSKGYVIVFNLREGDHHHYNIISYCLIQLTIL